MMNVVVGKILYSPLTIVVVILGLLAYLKPKSKRFVPINDVGSNISDTKAHSIAAQLWSAIITIKGTDERAIKNALYGLSKEDFNKVYNAFGKRQYSMFFGNQGDPLTSDKHDLITILQNELSYKELEELRLSNPNLPI